MVIRLRYLSVCAQIQTASFITQVGMHCATKLANLFIASIRCPALQTVGIVTRV